MEEMLECAWNRMMMMTTMMMMMMMMMMMYRCRLA